VTMSSGKDWLSRPSSTVTRLRVMRRTSRTRIERSCQFLCNTGN
jgi:hypothetical protein